MDILPELAKQVAARSAGAETLIRDQGLMFMASAGVTAPQALVYEPMFCLVLEGQKRTQLGEFSHVYGAGDYLVVSADLPVTGQVVEGPYAAVGVSLDLAEISQLVQTHPLGREPEATQHCGLRVSRIEPSLVDVVRRWLAVVDSPQDRSVLEPLLRRELIWHLLKGPHGMVLRQMAQEGGPLRQVHKVIGHLRQTYAERFRIEDLAALAGMSETSFYRHFKAVTAMSPLQFQKQLRLQAARQMLFQRGRDIAGIGYEVGYDSPSQFSREYSRLFGQPPARDLTQDRAAYPASEAHS